MNYPAKIKQFAAILALIGFASVSSYAHYEKKSEVTLCGVEMMSEPIYNTKELHSLSETYNYIIGEIKFDARYIRTCETKDGNLAVVGLYSDGQVRAFVFENYNRPFIYSYSF